MGNIGIQRLCTWILYARCIYVFVFVCVCVCICVCVWVSVGELAQCCASSSAWQCIPRANNLSSVKIVLVKYAKCCAYSKSLFALLDWGVTTDSLKNIYVPFSERRNEHNTQQLREKGCYNQTTSLVVKSNKVCCIAFHYLIVLHTPFFFWCVSYSKKPMGPHWCIRIMKMSCNSTEMILSFCHFWQLN